MARVLEALHQKWEEDQALFPIVHHSITGSTPGSVLCCLHALQPAGRSHKKDWARVSELQKGWDVSLQESPLTHGLPPAHSLLRSPGGVLGSLFHPSNPSLKGLQYQGWMKIWGCSSQANNLTFKPISFKYLFNIV